MNERGEVENVSEIARQVSPRVRDGKTERVRGGGDRKITPLAAYSSLLKCQPRTTNPSFINTIRGQ